MEIADGHDLQVLPVIGQAHRAPLLAPSHMALETPQSTPENLVPVARGGAGIVVIADMGWLLPFRPSGPPADSPRDGPG